MVDIPIEWKRDRWGKRRIFFLYHWDKCINNGINELKKLARSVKIKERLMGGKSLKREVIIKWTKGEKFAMGMARIRGYV